MTSTEEDEYLAEVVDFIAMRVASGKSMEATKASAKVFAFPPEVFDAARIQYERQVGIIREIGDPAALMSPATREQRWYQGPRASDAYWPGVRDRLASTLPEEALVSVDDSSSKILSVMSPPGIVEFATRGLVLGYVQSGKTTSFISLIAKAADCGYRVFIVLSGTTDNLRSQTQGRIDEVLLGDDAQLWHRLTMPDSDFAESSENAANLLSQPNMRFVAVVKKNPARLRKLRAWLKGAGPVLLAGAPILIIDDEADQASIDTSVTGKRTSTINKLLKEILAAPKAAYVAYTATPFANLLTDPKAAGGLYPADFIVPLPESPDYFGAERMFGTSERLEEDQPVSDGMDVIRSISIEESELVRPPKGRGSVYDWEPTLGGALVESIRWFILSTAARQVRRLGNRHATMLIHTSMLAEAHKRVARLVDLELDRIRAALEGNDSTEWGHFQDLYRSETVRVGAEQFGHTPVAFSELRSAVVIVLTKVKIVIDNYLSQDRLSYDDESPAISIVVGGNTLSRGLTLEGLTSSYFVRSASAYDTLLQMGRWFGYRKGYEDLCRVWMTSELQGWFRDLSLVEAEIRREISRYELEGIDPSEVAVRIRTHPDMAITSAAKMRHAIVSEMSFSSMRPQTILFSHQDRKWLDANLSAVKTLTATALRSGRVERRFPSGRRGFANLDSSDILKFISEYQFHPDARSLQSNFLSEYIRKENAVDSLLKWNVLFMENRNQGANSIDIGLSTALIPFQRSRMKHASKEGVANLKAIASTMDRAADLELDPAEVRRRANVFGSKVTDAALTIIREQEMAGRGLLCIYPIDRDSVPGGLNEKEIREDLDAVADLMGLTFFFPRARGVHSQVSYMAADLNTDLLEDPGEEDEQALAADAADDRQLESQE